jgi:hypothetical protein
MIHYQFVYDDGQMQGWAEDKVNNLARHGYTVRLAVSHNGRLLFVMGKECNTPLEREMAFGSAAEQEEQP